LESCASEEEDCQEVDSWNLYLLIYCVGGWGMNKVSFSIPIRTVSEANQREHWGAKNKRKLRQQEEVALGLYNADVPRGRECRKPLFLPCTVTLTRYGAKALDSDNLVGSFKHVQDAIARWIGVDDGEVDKVKFQYSQIANGKREYAVNVEIASVETLGRV
jgi:hypothetical protein